LADTVAIVSVISGATVAITVPFINSVLERQRLRWQGNQARLDELRSIVDSTIGEMARAHDLLYDIAVEGDKQGRLAERSAALTACYLATKTYGTQLGLRLGTDDDVTVSHTAVEGILANAEVVVEHDPDGVSTVRDQLGEAIAVFQTSVRDLIGPIRERRRQGT
jgi:uncharacterized protein YycO